MNNELYATLLDEIDEKIIERIAYERLENTKKRNIIFSRVKIILISHKTAFRNTVKLTLLMIGILVLIVINDGYYKNNSPITNNSLSPTVIDYLPSPIPGYTPNFIEPTIEDIFELEILSELFPKNVLSICKDVTSSYLSQPDDVVNAQGNSHLLICYNLVGQKQEKPWEQGLSIRIDKKNERAHLYEGEIVFYTYDDEITLNFVKEHMVFIDGIMRVVISFIYEPFDYEICYHYTGPLISAEEFYEMIMSADYFQNKK